MTLTCQDLAAIKCRHAKVSRPRSLFDVKDMSRECGPGFLRTESGCGSTTNYLRYDTGMHEPSVRIAGTYRYMYILGSSQRSTVEARHARTHARMRDSANAFGLEVSEVSSVQMS